MLLSSPSKGTRGLRGLFASAQFLDYKGRVPRSPTGVIEEWGI